jgi:molybdopterin/thiamine biosynthesis adenylyltransferase
MSDLSSSLEIPRIYAQDQASLGWWTAEDQELFYKQRVAILGTGGAGGGVAESLVRVGMQVTLADPDEFGETNLNRQNGSYRDTLGVNKAEAIAKQLQRIRPDADTRVFTEGITPENMDEVLKDATIVLDAIDIAHGALSIMVARRARKLGLPVFMGIEIGYGCSVTCFDPNETEMTAEHYYGVSNNQEITAETDISLSQIIVHMPSYSPRGMFEAFSADELPGTPGISPGVLILGGVMTTMINRWVLGRQQTNPSFVYPDMYVLDPIDGIKVVHASAREEQLTEAFNRIGDNPQSSGFSLPSSYKIRQL